MVEEKRRRRRVSVGFPVRISGSDASGKPFEEMTHSIDVSSGGVKCLVKAPLKLNLPVTITLPLPRDMRPVPSLEYAYTSRGFVARMDNLPTQPDKKAIVVKFLK